jgi:hypothetical protein
VLPTCAGTNAASSNLGGKAFCASKSLRVCSPASAFTESPSWTSDTVTATALLSSATGEDVGVKVMAAAKGWGVETLFIHSGVMDRLITPGMNSSIAACTGGSRRGSISKYSIAGAVGTIGTRIGLGVGEVRLCLSFFCSHPFFRECANASDMVLIAGDGLHVGATFLSTLRARA